MELLVLVSTASFGVQAKFQLEFILSR